jgi:hypothetical protein
MIRRLVFPLPLVLLLAVSCRHVPDMPPEYALGELPRVVAPVNAAEVYARAWQAGPDDFRMQTGSHRFRSQDGQGPEIELLGVAHIGEDAYYRAIQSRLDRADKVLFEMVADEREISNLRSALENEDPKSAYARLARSLGLRPQQGSIRYQSPHFVHCDLSLQQMQALLEAEIAEGGEKAQAAREALREMKKLGKALVGRSWGLNLALALVRVSDTLSVELRMALLLVSSGLDGDDPPMNARLMKLIREDRDAHVLREITRLRPHAATGERWIVFYGADHLPGIENGLRQIGYRPIGSKTWLDSVIVHPHREGMSAGRVRQLLEEAAKRE